MKSLILRSKEGDGIAIIFTKEEAKKYAHAVMNGIHWDKLDERVPGGGTWVADLYGELTVRLREMDSIKDDE